MILKREEVVSGTDASSFEAAFKDLQEKLGVWQSAPQTGSQRQVLVSTMFSLGKELAPVDLWLLAHHFGLVMPLLSNCPQLKGHSAIGELGGIAFEEEVTHLEFLNFKGGLQEAEGGWSLSGEKTRVLAAEACEFFLVLTKLKENPALVFLPAKAEGLEIKKKVGFGGRYFFDLMMKEVVIPEENLLFKEEELFSELKNAKLFLNLSHSFLPSLGWKLCKEASQKLPSKSYEKNFEQWTYFEGQTESILLSFNQAAESGDLVQSARARFLASKLLVEICKFYRESAGLWKKFPVLNEIENALSFAKFLGPVEELISY